MAVAGVGVVRFDEPMSDDEWALIERLMREGASLATCVRHFPNRSYTAVKAMRYRARKRLGMKLRQPRSKAVIQDYIARWNADEPIRKISRELRITTLALERMRADRPGQFKKRDTQIFIRHPDEQRIIELLAASQRPLRRIEMIEYLRAPARASTTLRALRRNGRIVIVESQRGKASYALAEKISACDSKRTPE